jgi:putative membrane protein
MISTEEAAAMRPLSWSKLKMIGTRTLSILAVLAFTGAAGAQTAPQKANQSAIDTPSAATNPHKHDQKMSQVTSPADFVQKAGLAGLIEVEVSKAALQKSKSPDIRKFAERMVQDHGKANTQLASIAKAKNLTVPKQLDAEHQKMVKDLSALKETEFDATYAQHMAQDHVEAVELFKNAASLSDAELSQFARTTLPTLQEHRQAAEALHSKVRSSSDVEPPRT